MFTKILLYQIISLMKLLRWKVVRWHLKSQQLQKTLLLWMSQPEVRGAEEVPVKEAIEAILNNGKSQLDELRKKQLLKDDQLTSELLFLKHKTQYLQFWNLNLITENLNTLSCATTWRWSSFPTHKLTNVQHQYKCKLVVCTIQKISRELLNSFSTCSWKDRRNIRNQISGKNSCKETVVLGMHSRPSLRRTTTSMWWTRALTKVLTDSLSALLLQLSLKNQCQKRSSIFITSLR